MDDTTTHDASPAERRRLKVRASILDAAERVFAEEGSDGLSIRRLAEEIDYSPAAIYKYFSSKEELVDELKEGFFARIMERVDSVQLVDGPYLERAHACIRTYIETALEKPQHYMAAFSDVRTHEVDDGSDCEDAPPDASNKMRAFAYLAGMVAEGQANGTLRTDVSNVGLAMSIWAACHGAATLMAHLPEFPETKPISSGLTRDSFLQLHAEILLTGLKRGHQDGHHHLPHGVSPALAPRKIRT